MGLFVFARPCPCVGAPSLPLELAGSARDRRRHAERGRAHAADLRLCPTYLPEGLPPHRVGRHLARLDATASALTGSPRVATNPANALLNYLYALLEGEAAIAARIVGLDPGLGVLHADQDSRDSLATDLMEPARPLVDRFALELLADRFFASADFHETRQGALAPGAAGLASSPLRLSSAGSVVLRNLGGLADGGVLTQAIDVSTMSVTTFRGVIVFALDGDRALVSGAEDRLVVRDLKTGDRVGAPLDAYEHYKTSAATARCSSSTAISSRNQASTSRRSTFEPATSAKSCSNREAR